jgi:hypothetical protein
MMLLMPALAPTSRRVELNRAACEANVQHEPVDDHVDPDL